MISGIRENLSNTSLKDALLLVCLSCLIVFFLAINSDYFPAGFWGGLVVFLFTLCLLFACWLFLMSGLKDPSKALNFARLSLSPFLLLLFLIPYSFFYTHIDGLKPFVCLGFILAGALIFNAVLKNDVLKKDKLQYFIPVVAAVYALYFGAIRVLRHINYQNTSSFDVALYSQIQWNNIHGRFFQSSISGSNFVTHNSPFLILLSPFYALYPHPETLLILKTLFLAVSLLPFCLILKETVSERSVFPLAVGYLFFPFMVGQNFNAPHEMCFLPPFLLFSFYFYLKNRFKLFLIFLLLSLSVKEHMALVSVLYGLYALYLKKSKRWIIVPVLLGVAWGGFSLWIIAHFQSIYHVDPYPAWLIDNIKTRFLRPDHSFWSNIVWGLKTSVLGQTSSLFSIYLLLSPLLLFLPFYSSVWVLGLPEMAINLLATLPLSYPTWNYDIVASVFLLIASAQAVRKISLNPLLSRLELAPDKFQELLAWLLCISVLCHFFLWWDYTEIKQDPRYVKTINAALGLVPQEASVSLNKFLAAYVTDRKDYFLCEDKRKGDYIVLARDDHAQDCFKTLQQAALYAPIFNQEGVRVLRRAPD